MIESRISDGEYQTTAFDMQRGDTLLTFIGAIHVGGKSYYESIQSQISEAEQRGAAIHYEGVQWSLESSPLELSDEELAAYSEALSSRSHQRIVSILAEELGLVRQQSAVNFSSEWENHDMHATELMRSIGLEELLQYAIYDELSEETPPHEIASFFVRGMLKYHYGPDQGKAAPSEATILREKRAVDAATRHFCQNPDQDLLLLWGCNHAESFKRSFVDLGFEEIERRWNTAFDVYKMIIDGYSGLDDDTLY